MEASAILATLRAGGLRLDIAGDDIRVAPKAALTDETRQMIRQHKSALVAELRRAEVAQPTVHAANQGPRVVQGGIPAKPPANTHSQFAFGRLTDRKTIDELAAVMMASNNWSRAIAFQEARWAVDRERCWRRFLTHAEAIQAAPVASREALLTDYQRSATATFGPTTAGYMAATMRDWLASSTETPWH